MTSCAEFLVEIGTEELPPRSLRILSEAFRDEFQQLIANTGIARRSDTRVFATPRRLALSCVLDTRQADVRNETAGPLVSAAFDSQGSPTKAALGFASRFGVDVAALARIDSDKGMRLAFSEAKEGKPTRMLIGEVVAKALDRLPVPKRMRWGANRFQFVRPVHWVLMLFDGQVCDVELFGLKAGNTSCGHRFHAPDEIVISDTHGYIDRLREAKVIAEFAERRGVIRAAVNEVAKKSGGQAVIDDTLLDEVTALNEWPVALLGYFEQRFLEVPPEALVCSMKEHQKYFHVVDSRGDLMPCFVAVANIDSSAPELIVSGNERVIRPRLSDAAFFYKTDLKTPLAARAATLKHILFQSQLGTLYDKSERIAGLAERICTSTAADPSLARRAALLAKADLASDMVGEFDTLQGIMGRYYALHDGENSEVADAIYEHYLPRFADDQIPATPLGRTLALADRLDTLTAIFGIGQIPSGSRDPFALRRASLGVLRILIECKIDLHLGEMVRFAASQLPHIQQQSEVSEQVLTYIFDRMKSMYRDKGVAIETINAVLAVDSQNPMDMDSRIRAVELFIALPEAPALAVANKRVANILSGQGSLKPGAKIDEHLLTEPAERTLYTSLNHCSSELTPLLSTRNYGAALKCLASLREPVDLFFDHVMVMSESQNLRNNRLALLQKLRELFLQVADVSFLAPTK